MFEHTLSSLFGVTLSRIERHCKWKMRYIENIVLGSFFKNISNPLENTNGDEREGADAIPTKKIN